jgi:hypothetical protein
MTGAQLWSCLAIFADFWTQGPYTSLSLCSPDILWIAKKDPELQGGRSYIFVCSLALNMVLGRWLRPREKCRVHLQSGSHQYIPQCRCKHWCVLLWPWTPTGQQIISARDLEHSRAIAYCCNICSFPAPVCTTALADWFIKVLFATFTLGNKLTAEIITRFKTRMTDQDWNVLRET